jgi:hypothetical protein
VTASEPGPAKPAAGVSRGLLYFLALVALGILVLPIVLQHPSLSRREKIFFIALGGAQTLAAVVCLVLFAVWMLGWLRRLAEAG